MSPLDDRALLAQLRRDLARMGNSRRPLAAAIRAQLQDRISHLESKLGRDSAYVENGPPISPEPLTFTRNDEAFQGDSSCVTFVTATGRLCACGCGVEVPDDHVLRKTRDDRAYTSAACRQRAYRQRKASAS